MNEETWVLNPPEKMQYSDPNDERWQNEDVWCRYTNGSEVADWCVLASLYTPPVAAPASVAGTTILRSQRVVEELAYTGTFESILVVVALSLVATGHALRRWACR